MEMQQRKQEKGPWIIIPMIEIIKPLVIAAPCWQFTEIFMILHPVTGSSFIWFTIDFFLQVGV